ncbi:hypothetical protein ACLQ26_19215 [Micromonospora sp. DT43]|uniref:hypothetical protein n=1 Tax=Micromonospora sp. DT43 TaxID=3393440 RepID=UPI003CE882C1
MVTELAAVTSVAISLVALGVSLIVQREQRRYQDFELARSLHHDVSTGEVAQARHLLGTLVRSSEPIDGTAKREALQAYFTLLWCFERIYVGHQTMGPGRPQRFLAEAVRWHVLEWDREIGAAKRKLEDQPGEIDDVHSREGLRKLGESLR